MSFSALASLGVCARNWCCTREPSCARISSGTSVGRCVTKKMPTPLERMRRTVCVTDSMKAFDAPWNNKCASSKKNTSLGLSASPTSGSCSNSSASSHIRNVENSAGRFCTAGSSSIETTPAGPSVRSRSEMSNSGSPKKASAPCASRLAMDRRITPAEAVDTPPMLFSSAFPSSEVRNMSTALRSLKSSRARPLESA